MLKKSSNKPSTIFKFDFDLLKKYFFLSIIFNVQTKMYDHNIWQTNSKSKLLKNTNSSIVIRFEILKKKAIFNSFKRFILLSYSIKKD